ncbi:MAG TPA: hypothetical protein VFJ16_26170 [Longimicrobium sp.]|nr:hypothetical protein [Longimicrobium sp.]
MHALQLESLVVESFVTAPAVAFEAAGIDTIRQCIASHRITCEISCDGTC